MKASNLFIRPNKKLSAAIEHAVESGELHAQPRKLEPGEYLFHNNGPLTCTYYLTRGIVKLSATRETGATKTVFFHKAGTLIGFKELQESEEDKASMLDACAMSVCELYAIDAHEFAAYLKAHGDVCYEMLRYMFDMMVRQTSEATNMAAYSTLERFAALLMEIARDLHLLRSPAVVPFRNADLAEMLGVHVNSITNCVKSLQNAMCVDRRHGFIVITDFKKLKSIAGDLLD